MGGGEQQAGLGWASFKFQQTLAVGLFPVAWCLALGN